MITLLVLGLLIYVLIQHFLFQRSGAGPIKMFFLFFQTVQLIAQSSARWLPVFVSVLNVQPAMLSSGDRCLYPASWYDRFAFQLAVPFMLAAALAIITATVRVVQHFSRRSSNDQRNLNHSELASVSAQSASYEPLPSLDEPLLTVDPSGPAHDSNAVNPDSVRTANADGATFVPSLWSRWALLRSMVALTLLGFQLWVYRVFSFLDCVQVGDRLVMTATPAVDCESSSYKTWAPLYYTLVPVTVALPLALAYLLRKLKPFITATARRSSAVLGAQPKPSKTQIRWLYVLGVCFEGYRPEVYWFEVAMMAIRWILALASTLSDMLWPVYADRRLFVLTLLLALACGMHIRVQPFVSPVANRLGTFVWSSLTIISNVAMYRLLTAASFRPSDHGVEVTLVVCVFIPSIILMLLALLFIVATCKQSRLLRYSSMWLQRVFSKSASLQGLGSLNDSRDIDRQSNAQMEAHGQSSNESAQSSRHLSGEPYVIGTPSSAGYDPPAASR